MTTEPLFEVEGDLLPRDDAAAKAQTFLNGDGGDFIVDESTMIPNAMQGLWIVSFVDRQGHGVLGGGLVVTKDDVYYLSSAPGAIEYVGALMPEDEDDEPEDDEDDEINTVLALYGDQEQPDEIEALLEQFAHPAEEGPASRYKPPARKPAAKKAAPSKPSSGGGGPKKGGGGGFDPSEHPRGDKGSPKGGRFIPKGSGGGGGSSKDKPASGGDSRGPAKEEPTKTKQQQVNAVVKGLLDIMDDLLDQLSGPQAQALIKQIKRNAEAFVEGQRSSHPSGGGGHKGPAKKGGPAKKAAPGKPGVDGKPGGGADSGGGPPGTAKAILNSVKGLLKGFGGKMRPNQKARLEHAIKVIEDA